MGSPERGYVLQNERKGPADWWKGFNEKTRNIGLVVLGGALVLGASGVATVAAISVIIDQSQIMIIDAYKRWRNKSSGKMQLQSV